CSRATVMNCFKAEFGTTVNNYVTEKRLDLASVLLKGSRDSVKSIAVTCGFRDQNCFSRVFMKRFGTTPTSYREKNNKKTPS
ncbi:MAG: helix-turn-helix transcriptional regulator, partial [Oscillospiraceae bacterium]|nr:helix-turn-helix transcriptional regulator [Oscillospiraceae bacterium]